MLVVMRQVSRGFRRGIPEKEKDACTDGNEEQIIDEKVLLFVFWHENHGSVAERGAGAISKA
ncbi:hypothetical protein LDFHOB_11375 [Candidatus Electronema aureum]